MSDLEILSANLQAIYSVAHKPLYLPPKQAATAPIEKGIVTTDNAVILTPVPAPTKAPLKALSEPNLVANYSGTRIYNTAHCWGRVWTIIYKVLGFFAGESLQIRKLKEAIIKTNDIFNENRVQIEEHLKKYEKYIVRCLDRKRKNFSEEEISISRNAITAWNDSTRPFLKFIRKNGIKTILDVFRQNLKLRPTERLHFLYPPLDGNLVAKKGLGLIDKKGVLQIEGGKPAEDAAKKDPPAPAAPELKAPEQERKEAQASKADKPQGSTEQSEKALAADAPKMLTANPQKAKTDAVGVVAEPFNTDLLEKAHQLQHLIDLQGLHPDPQPGWFFDTISSITRDQLLSADHERRIDKFVKRLNELYDKKELSPRYLHKILQSTVEILRTHDDEKDLARLEHVLSEHGCKLFHLEDPIHLKWRNQLKPGDKILMTEQNGDKKEVILGPQLGMKRDGDKNVYFKVVREGLEKFVGKVLEVDVVAEGSVVLGKAGEQLTGEMLKCMTDAGVETIRIVDERHEIPLMEETLVWIHINSSILPIKKLLRDMYKGPEQHGVLGVIDFKGMDKEGRFALVDRLRFPLQNIDWDPGMTDLNKKACRDIIKLVKGFIEHDQTPENFSPKFLMFDKKTRLKSTRIPTQGKNFDFNAVEDFIFEISKSNLNVFQYLMSMTKLTKSKTAEFYRKMVGNALNGVSDSADNVAERKGVVEPSIADRGQDIYKAVITLKKCCCERLKKAEIAGNLDTQVGAQIQIEYDKTCASGILWPDLEDRVVEQLARGTNKDD
jgi:hypothetical protein